MTTLDIDVTISVAGARPLTLRLDAVPATALTALILAALDAGGSAETPTPPQESEVTRAATIEPIKRSQRKPKAEGEGEGEFPCESCERVFGGAHALSVHRSRSHKTAPVLAEVPPPAADDEYLLRCGDCDFTTTPATFAKLRTHTTTEHQRMPIGNEPTPRRAADLDEATA